MRAVLDGIEALQRISDDALGKDEDETVRIDGWQWHETEASAGPAVADEEENVHRIAPRDDAGRLILGWLELRKRTLTLITTSQQRVERSGAVLEQALGTLVLAPEIRSQTTEETVDSLMAMVGGEGPNDGEPGGPDRDTG